MVERWLMMVFRVERWLMMRIRMVKLMGPRSWKLIDQISDAASLLDVQGTGLVPWDGEPP